VGSLRRRNPNLGLWRAFDSAGYKTTDKIRPGEVRNLEILQ
jgi:hypothetical protein